MYSSASGTNLSYFPDLTRSPWVTRDSGSPRLMKSWTSSARADGDKSVFTSM